MIKRKIFVRIFYLSAYELVFIIFSTYIMMQINDDVVNLW